MLWNEATNLLQLNITQGWTYQDLKRQYHKQALQCHPDKNGNTESSKQLFQQINEAYDILKERFEKEQDDEEDERHDIKRYKTDQSPLSPFFSQFTLSNLFEGKYNEYLFSFFKRFVSKQLILQLFHGMNYQQSIVLYNWMEQHYEALHIEINTLHQIKQTLEQKKEKETDVEETEVKETKEENETKVKKLLEEETIYVSLNDLLENRVYKLIFENKVYWVPLWHHELLFEIPKEENEQKRELKVLCCPMVSDDMWFDEDNHLHMNYILPFSSTLLYQSHLIIPLTTSHLLYLPVEQLLFQPIQTHIFKQQGIPQINVDDMYCTLEYGDVIVTIEFVFQEHS